MGQVIELLTWQTRPADPFSERERQQLILLARNVTSRMADIAFLRGQLTVNLLGYLAQIERAHELIDGVDDPESRALLSARLRQACNELQDNFEGLFSQLDSVSLVAGGLIASLDGVA